MSAVAVRVAPPPFTPAEPAEVRPRDLASTTYQELKRNGLSDVDIMAFAGELLDLVASGVREAGSA